MTIQQKAASVWVGVTFILAALFAAPLPVRWLPFLLSLTGMAAGLVWLRRFSKREDVGISTGKNTGVSVLLVFLEELQTRVQSLLKKQEVEEKQTTDDWADELAAIQVRYFAPVTENRDALIERYGVKRYADFMIPFATAERYFNRSVSAAMDGYVEESVQSLKECLPFLQTALTILQK